MPSGGGVVGGGGAGGGGFVSNTPYFANFPHNHDASGDGNMSKGCWAALVCTVLFFVFSTVGLVLGLGVGVGARYGESSVFSPGDSRVITLSSFFCQGTTLELSLSSVDATLFRLDEVPPLNVRNNFTIPLRFSITPREYRFWQYYLYPNSYITISARANIDTDVYIVKGDRNAQRWESSPRASLAVKTSTIDLFSPDITYTVTEADEYYVYFYNSLDSTDVSVSGSLYFERLEYTSPSDSVDNCTVSQEGQCTIDISYSIRMPQFLVLTSIPEDVDFGENVGLMLSCEQREWAYALVIVLPLVVTLLVTVCTLMACCWHCKRKGSSDLGDSLREELAPLNEEDT